jgi:peptidoglycan L-alanyl-D-glutamate endopeptidase CwlK
MINSRSLDDLLPAVKVRVEKFINSAKDAGIDLLITSTYRDNESQNALFAQGRSVPGKIVTNAKGGQSFHNYRCAVDVVPLVNGKPIWDVENDIWQKIGDLGVANGLEWAGNWKQFKEYPHFQYTNGFTLAQLQIGKKII